LVGHTGGIRASRRREIETLAFPGVVVGLRLEAREELAQTGGGFPRLDRASARCRQARL
jgi:hypothetical protein